MSPWSPSAKQQSNTKRDGAPAAHLARLSEERRDAFVTAIVGGVCPPLDYVRLNISAVREPE